MAIPISYNVRSIAARWKTAIVSVLGIAGTVGVFVAMLAMARGFQATLIASGSASNSIVRRAGSSSEMDSGIMLDQARVIADTSQVARNAEGIPLSSPETVVIGAFQLIKSGTDANTQIRGMTPLVLEVRPSVKIAESLIIATVGGAIGVGLAKLFTMGGDPTGGMLPVFYLSTGEMLLGLGIAIFVGLAAGSIPALTAMNLRIVDALRRV